MEDFASDFQSLFATEDDIESSNAVTNDCPIFSYEEEIVVNGFLDNNGIVNLEDRVMGPYSVHIVITKNDLAIPFVDFRLNIVNPPDTLVKLFAEICVINRISKEFNIESSQDFTISRHYSSAFFLNLVSFKTLTETSGFIENGAFVFRLRLKNSSTPVGSFYGGDSRQTTGFVGLQNQGATCYMNSLLQSLFHLPVFRKFVYQIPTQDVENPELSIPLQLQRLFYNMQYSNNAVATKDLTKSFGWKNEDIMVQHDIQEFNRVLIANLENKVKDTDLENEIRKLFRGKIRSYVKCVNVDFEASNETDFYDLQLHVKDNANLQDSFEQYLHVERLDGSNQYRVEGHGKQDADLGIEFLAFPPVLQIHLNRFTYDYEKESIVKINDHYEYPESIDLAQYLKNYSNNPKLYDLVGVLVHSGTNYSGHYYAYIRPTPESDWLMFNDSQVKRVKKEDVFDANFGEPLDTFEEIAPEPQPKVASRKKFTGKAQRNPFKKNKSQKAQKIKQSVDHSAYLLIYASRDEKSAIYHPPGDEAPSHLHEYFAQLAVEQEEKRRQMIEKSTTVEVQIVCEDMLNLISSYGFSVKEDQKRTILLGIQDSISSVISKISEKFSIEPETVRLWQCGAYGNPIKFLSRSDDKPIGNYVSRSSVLFAQIKDSKEEEVVEPDYYVVYIKYFDYETQKTQFLGSSKYNKNTPVNEIVKTSSIQFLGNTQDQYDIFIEEYGGKPRMIDSDTTLAKSRSSNGTMLAFQKHPPNTLSVNCISGDHNVFRFDQVVTSFDIRLYYNHMLMQLYYVTLEICSIDSSDKKLLQIPLSIDLMVLKEAISRMFMIEYDPERSSILLFICDPETKAIKPRPVKLANMPRVEQMISSWPNKKDHIPIFFEYLSSYSEEQMNNNLYMTITLSNDAIHSYQSYTQIFPIEYPIRKVFEQALESGFISGNISEFRFITIWGLVIWEILKPNNLLNDDSVSLRIEKIPENQRSLEEGEFLIKTAHDCPQDQESTFQPLLLLIKPDETIIELRTRLQVMYGLTEKEVQKWKFEVSYTQGSKDKREILKDKDLISKYEINKNLELVIVHNMNQYTGNTRKHVPIKILN